MGRVVNRALPPLLGGSLEHYTSDTHYVKVVFACRNEGKAVSAIQKITDERAGADCAFIHLDLGKILFLKSSKKIYLYIFFCYILNISRYFF